MGYAAHSPINITSRRVGQNQLSDMAATGQVVVGSGSYKPIKVDLVS